MSEYPSRRKQDGKLDEIMIRLDTLEREHQELQMQAKQHLEEYHANLKSGQTKVLINEHRDMVENIDTIATLVAGEKIVDPITHEWHGRREPGMAQRQELMAIRVEKLEHRSNGGGGFSIRNKDKLVIGAIASVPAVVSLLIGYLALTGG